MRWLWFISSHDVIVKFPSVLVIHSDRGMGKSSLVVNWVRYFSAENPEVKVISHFIGSSGRSRDVSMFLQKCVKALREEYLPDGEQTTEHQLLFFIKSAIIIVN